MELFLKFMLEKLSYLFLPRPSHNSSFFSKLSLNPENFPNSMTVFIQLLTACSFYRNRVVSSANYASCMILLSPLILISKPTFLFFLVLFARISTTKRNRRALRGHPCRIPLCISNGLKVQPLFVKHASALLYIVSTHLRKDVPN